MSAPVFSLHHTAVESAMPRLPVPPLEATIAKYLETILPFCSPEEYERNKKLAGEFVHSKDAQILQALLHQRAETERWSWLERWWFNSAYFDFREPTPINVSYSMRFVDLPHKRVTQLQRAASLCEGLIWLKSLIEKDQYPTEMGKNGKPLCMAAMRYAFHSCRIPSETRDYAELYWPKESSHDVYVSTTHIVVLRRGKFYSFSSVHPDGTPLTLNELHYQLAEIVEMEKESPAPYPALGIMSANDRNTWAKAREKLLKSAVNYVSLHHVQSCAFILCLDEVAPKDDQRISEQLLHGGHRDCYNRFFDKPLQLIVLPNGKAGICGEHSGMDGQPLGVALDALLDRMSREREQPLSSYEEPSEPLVEPYRLEWETDQEIEYEVSAASRLHHAAIDGLSFTLLRFKHFGKTAVKKYRVSPDAVVQLSLQLAYYRLHKTFTPTYESASTRQFARGRTETGRSVHKETVEFVLAAESDAPVLKKYELFKKAADAHVKYVKEAVQGRGIDRHLLGLRLLAQEKNIPLHPLFSDPLFARTSYWQLSTSQIDLKNMCASSSSITPSYSPLTIGFGPVVPDGYGVCYLIRKDDIMVALTSFRAAKSTDSAKLSSALEASLRDILEIVAAQPSAKL